ncbi:MAG: hypothetical protein IKU26_03525, partial [Clostridia bacterium]|nr:hypothetical protein [Clostridia bacterium]
CLPIPPYSHNIAETICQSNEISLFIIAMSKGFVNTFFRKNLVILQGICYHNPSTLKEAHFDALYYRK